MSEREQVVVDENFVREAPGTVLGWLVEARGERDDALAEWDGCRKVCAKLLAERDELRRERDEALGKLGSIEADGAGWGVEL